MSRLPKAYMPISTPATQAKRRSESWPWKMWLAIIVVFVFCVAAYWFFKPALEFSLPELSYHDGICVAQFDATNHTDNRVDADLRVVVGGITMGSEVSPRSYTEFAHKTFSVSLAPREKKRLICNITMPSSSLRGNDVHIEVESFVQSAR